MNPDREALLNGKDRSKADKEYDERLRQMVFEKRSKPTERTMTEEEKVAEEAKRLEDLEAKRIRRMEGGRESSDEEIGDNVQNLQGDDDVVQDDAETFKLGAGISGGNSQNPLDVEDEDEFVIEDDLVASGSDVVLSEDDESADESASEASENGDDRDFVQGLLSKDDMDRLDFDTARTGASMSNHTNNNDHLAFTYPCPQSHEELLQATQEIGINDLPTVVQRIRALYHPKLQGDYKAKLGVFSTVLVDHLAYLTNQTSRPPFAVLETLTRHIHSLAKTYPEEIGRAFRSHLKSLHDSRPFSPTPGDLVILTAVASIFPTSDHFHPVVTPAILSMARYLGQKLPHSLSDLAKGAYLETLCLQYQRLSKRYVPELLNYALNALCILAPVKPDKLDNDFPYHEPATSLRLQTSSENVGRRLRFWDVLPPIDSIAEDDARLKSALFETQLGILGAMANLWVGKSAFYEIFDVAFRVLQHLSGKACRTKLPTSTN
ncbi:MAG: nucleolar complex protein 14, partial [Pleopsidium flavum]